MDINPLQTNDGSTSSNTLLLNQDNTSATTPSLMVGMAVPLLSPSINGAHFSEAQHRAPRQTNGKRPARKHSNQWQATTLLDTSTLSSSDKHRVRQLALQPRPFEELHNERSYLLYNLQRQDERAKKLMSSLSATTDLLTATHGGNGARKLRKQLNLLSIKIGESAEQEKLILLRLSDLYVEIQSRERWYQVQQQRTVPWMPHTLALWTQPDLMSPVSPAVSNWSMPSGYFTPSFPMSPLSPMSPCFVPGMHPFDIDFHHPVCNGASYETQADTESSEQPEGRCERDEAEHADACDELPQQNDSDDEVPQHEQRPTSRRLSLTDCDISMLRAERRMSLPAMTIFL